MLRWLRGGEFNRHGHGQGQGDGVRSRMRVVSVVDRLVWSPPRKMETRESLTTCEDWKNLHLPC